MSRRKTYFQADNATMGPEMQVMRMFEDHLVDVFGDSLEFG